MPKFLVWIELHKTDMERPDYARVHHKLVASDFRSLIKDTKGVVRRLPRLTYARIAAVSAVIVQQDVDRAIRAAGWPGSFGAVVAEVKSISIEGLQTAGLSERLDWLAQQSPLIED